MQISEASVNTFLVGQRLLIGLFTLALAGLSLGMALVTERDTAMEVETCDE
jgi:hypothetical protein